ncbi:MAG: GPP34 family phosphoprotein [Pseudomonadota bacterium]
MTLTLPEEILLLMLDDESGHNKAGLPSYLTSGAALADLVFKGVLTTTGEKKKARFAFVDGAEEPDDNYLRAVIAILREKGVSAHPRDVVSRLANKRVLMNLLRDGLVQRGVLKRETKKILFFFTQTTYPTLDPAPERALKDRLRTALFTSGPVAPEDAVLITLAQAGGALRRNFDKAELKERKARIKEITSGDNVAAGATKAAIEALQAAILVTTIIPATVATT